MSCCINCFHDDGLKRFIRTHAKDNYNETCSFCSSESALCINPKLLAGQFDFIIGSFEKFENGIHLANLLDEHFYLFHKNVHDKKLLLEAILGPTYKNIKYKLKESIISHTENWDEFKEEIKHENRFFPNSSIYSSLFLQSKKDSIFFEIIAQLEKKVKRTDKFYRARVSDSPSISKELMGAPPSYKSLGGRANPLGISYLYLASNIETCIAEVRPSNASSIHISEFYLLDDQTSTIIDLTEPRKDISIMTFEAEKHSNILSYIKLLDTLSFELSRPISPNTSNIDYIPTQLLCEFFKSVGKYGGIAYKSSFNKGVNYVFFNPKQFSNEAPKKYYVTDISYNYKSEL